MHSDKENQELNVVGRLISMEALVFLMGVVSLLHGLLTRDLWNIVIGAVILVVAVILARKYRRGCS